MAGQQRKTVDKTKFNKRLFKSFRNRIKKMEPEGAVFSEIDKGRWEGIELRASLNSQLVFNEIASEFLNARKYSLRPLTIPWAYDKHEFRRFIFSGF